MFSYIGTCMWWWPDIQAVLGERLVFEWWYTNYFNEPVLKPSQYVTSARIVYALKCCFLSSSNFLVHFPKPIF